MSSVVDRTMVAGNILDRLDTLERQMRDILDNAATPQNSGQTPEQPDWSTISGWVITGDQFRDVYGHIVLDSTVPSITLGTGGILESEDYESGVSGFHIDGGEAEFNDVVIRGTIYADVGEIGGWIIDAQHITAQYGTGDTMTLDADGEIVAGTHPNIAVMSAYSDTHRFWAGHWDPALAPFSVTKAGVVYATGAVISGAITAVTGHLGTLDVTGSVSVGTAAPYILIDGVNKRIRTSTFTSGLAGFSLDSSGDAEFNSILVRGAIHASVFEKATVSAFAGSWIVTQSAGKLAADYTVGGTMTVESPPGAGWLFATGDIVRIKAEYSGGVGDTWLTVTRTGTENQYTTTYQSGTNSITWPKGTAAVDYGASGKGGLFATADETNSPRLDVFTHAGTPWTTLTLRARLGNLNGWGPFSTERYGWAVGDYSGGKYAYYDPTDGLVISGNLVIGPGTGFVASGVLLHCPFDGPLPYNTDFQVNTSGHLGQVATVTGGVIGRPGKFGKAVQVAEATTNLIHNPSNEIADETNGDANGTPTVTRVSTYAYVGSWSRRIQTDASNQGYGYIVTSDTSVGETYAFSVQMRGSGTVRLAFYDDNNGWTYGASITLSGAWTRYALAATYSVASTTRRVYILQYGAGSADIYTDAWQLEHKTYATPYCDGSLGTGHSWSGTAHASTSSRMAGYASYPVPGNVNAPTGSVSMWFNIHSYNPDAGLLWCAGDTNAELDAYVSPAGVLVFSVNSASVTYGTTVSLGQWHYAVCTWDCSTNLMYVYLDGVASSPGTPTTTSPTLGTLIGVGYSPPLGMNYFCNGLIDDLAIFDHALTADEVKQLYTSNAPITVATSPFNLMLTGQGLGRVLGNANGLFGYDAGGNEAFALATGPVAWGTLYSGGLAAGDLVLGDPDTGGHLYYDASDGKLKFRGAGSTTDQVWIGTDGKLLAGAGNVLLDANGIRIKTAQDGSLFDVTRALQVLDADGVVYGYLGGYYTSSGVYTGISAKGRAGDGIAVARLEAKLGTSGPYINCQDYSGNQVIHIGGAAQGLYVENDIYATADMLQGVGALGTHTNSRIHSAGTFADNGDAQFEQVTVRRQVTHVDNATWYDLYNDGSSTQLTVAADTAWWFYVWITGVTQDVAKVSGHAIVGVIKRVGNTTTLPYSSVTTYHETDATWDVQCIADDANDALVIKVKAAASDTVRWLAEVGIFQLHYT